MNYEDFDLLVEPVAGRDYRVSVLRSPGGEGKVEVRFPYDEIGLKNRLLTLENALLRSGGKRRRMPNKREKEVLNFGQTLFDTLFSGDVRSCYDVSWDRVRSEGKGLRIKLRFETEALSTLPWEFLHDPRRGEYLALSNYTPLVRYFELAQSLQAMPVVSPLRILGMIASPADLPELDVAVEKERVEQATADLRAEGVVDLVWLEGQSWRELQKAMRRGPWHIFHFIGHGMFDARADEGSVIFANRNGRSQRMSATNLARLLGDHAALRLVFLNSCEGGQGGQDVFSSTASILVRRGVPCVLAMQYEVTDAAAVEFSRTFYEAIADGLPLESAVTDARKAITFAVNNSLEWGTPVFFSHAPDGVLFELSVKKEAPPRVAVPLDVEQERLQRLLASGESAQAEGGWGELRGIARAILLEDPDQRQAQSWLQEADKRLQSKWATTASGLPIINSWAQLRGVDPLPTRILWEKDGKEMALIPAGVFTMGSTEQTARRLAKEWGYDEKWILDETPQREVSLGAYYMDVTPVSHDEYAQFLAANSQHQVPYVDESWAEPYNWNQQERRPPKALLQHPVVLVSWIDAQAYTRWAGKLLPSEEQWEKAARGTDGRRYPWGRQWDSARLNSAERIAGRAIRNYKEWKAWWDKLELGKKAYTTPVGMYPTGASPYGLMDMAGNVWEWCLDWYQAYPGSEAEHEEFGEKYRVVRGGSWYDLAFNVRTSFRYRGVPSDRYSYVGFRCASTPF
jgi:formylglycine-generating enzyme required for sulfatase activity